MSHTTFKVGRLTCHALEGGTQRLDGGAMFGVVPKPLWQRRIPADERNRIPLALRCLLVEHDAGLVLVDTGLGNKEDDKFKDIYGVANEGKNGRTQLEDALAELGYQPADIRWVIDTHLHFDHAGGNTYRDPSGRVTPSFPQARYVVQRKELEFARHTNERSPVFAACRPRATCPITSRYWSRAAVSGCAFSRTSSPPAPICRSPGSWGTTSSRS